GSYDCRCKTGFAGSGKNCYDIDECDIDECLSNPCQELEKCINKNGTFSCECQAGYRMNNGTCTGIVMINIAH
ncbi:thrombomodulin-like, partial [Lampetra fluviatilis]